MTIFCLKHPCLDAEHGLFRQTFHVCIVVFFSILFCFLSFCYILIGHGVIPQLQQDPRCSLPVLEEVGRLWSSCLSIVLATCPPSSLPVLRPRYLSSGFLQGRRDTVCVLGTGLVAEHCTRVAGKSVVLCSWVKQHTAFICDDFASRTSPCPLGKNRLTGRRRRQLLLAVAARPLKQRRAWNQRPFRAGPIEPENPPGGSGFRRLARIAASAAKVESLQTDSWAWRSRMTS